MDHAESSLQSQKTRLVDALDDCRAALQTSAEEVSSALDLPGQFRASFASGRWRWLAGALVAGVVSGFVLVSRSRSRSKERGPKPRDRFGSRLFGTVLQTSLSTLVFPLLSGLLQGRTENWLRELLERREG